MLWNWKRLAQLFHHRANSKPVRGRSKSYSTVRKVTFSVQGLEHEFKLREKDLCSLLQVSFSCRLLGWCFWEDNFPGRVSSLLASRIDLPPNVWFHCSVNSSSHRYRGNHGLESRWRPIFSGFFFQIALTGKFTTMRHSSLSSTTAIKNELFHIYITSQWNM